MGINTINDDAALEFASAIIQSACKDYLRYKRALYRAIKGKHKQSERIYQWRVESTKKFFYSDLFEIYCQGDIDGEKIVQMLDEKNNIWEKEYDRRTKDIRDRTP